MSAVQAIQDNLSVLAHVAATYERGNDLALIERIRRDLTYLRGYDDAPAFIEAIEEATIAVEAIEATSGEKEEQGLKVGTGSKFDKV